jgi:hypothetical protein
MGSDFCSAPGKCYIQFVLAFLSDNLNIASLVDAEQAFSNSRLEVNHLQHNMSPQTLKAQMAVGSWAKTPLYPGLGEVTRIIERSMEGTNASEDAEGV